MKTYCNDQFNIRGFSIYHCEKEEDKKKNEKYSVHDWKNQYYLNLQIKHDPYKSSNALFKEMKKLYGNTDNQRNLREMKKKPQKYHSDYKLCYTTVYKKKKKAVYKTV